MLPWLRDKGIAGTFPHLSPFGGLFHMGVLQGTKATHSSSSSTCRVLVKLSQISSLPPNQPTAFSPS